MTSFVTNFHPTDNVEETFSSENILHLEVPFEEVIGGKKRDRDFGVVVHSDGEKEMERWCLKES